MPELHAITPAHTASLDTDLVPVVKGTGDLAPMPRSVFLSDVPRILAASTISGNTTVTVAHANRPVNVTAVASCTVDTTNMVDGDGFEFAQVGSGALTLTGANVVLAPGVASATTNGDKSVLLCRFRASDSSLVAYYRTAVAAGGGGSGPSQNLKASGLPNSGTGWVVGTPQTIASITVQPLDAGAEIHIRALVEIDDTTADQVIFFIRFGGQVINQFSVVGGDNATMIDQIIACPTTSSQVTQPFGAESDGTSPNNKGTSTVDTTTAQTLELRAQKQTTATRVVTAHLFSARVW